MRKTILFLALTGVVGLGLYIANKYYFQRVTDIPAVFTDGLADEVNIDEAPALTTYVSGRKVIWAMDILPDGRMVFTEREGTVSVVEPNGSVTEILHINVHAEGESGLHGIAVDPDFSQNNFIYLYYTYTANNGDAFNRVSRFVYRGGLLDGEKIIIDEIPGASTHDGGRLKFGPDSFLYITTGDAQKPSRSQDKISLSGKILRVTRDGDPAPRNPFGTRIYSYGHRNSQGLTWDEQNRLWATEHGSSAHDELNSIESGINYGWPEITGEETRTNMQSPIMQSGKDTWAPAGAAYYSGSIFFGGLRGSALYEYNIATSKLTEHLKNRLGRIRDVIVGSDGFLYVSTSNRDGRGVPSTDDDRIIRINPGKLGEI